MEKIKNKFLILPIIVLVISLSTLIFSKYTSPKPSYKAYTSFKDELKLKKISTVYITDSNKIKFMLTNGQVYETDNPGTNNFKEALLSSNIKVLDQYPLNNIEKFSLIGLLVSIVCIIATYLRSSKIKTKKSFSVDAIDAKAIENPDFTFKNMAGNEEAKESVQ
ncbi:ATP-dependent metallopeptidase FtsH/Yme1/Tma family protein, partial [Clostridium tyrobutyricum]|uniref:ATP-dependent metallopeptidase FtsH/Yme1/Tma family protein n=1 Tax=Clostridium tyrobutyricum TaxID=1519 RepID=UPI00054EF2C8